MADPDLKILNTEPLDDEEAASMAALDAALEAGTIVSELTPERKAELEAMARATMSPPKTQITTRLAKQDLIKLKAKALEMGMPYQTLLASIVHRYVEGRLVDKE
ncbi:MAG: hypothetical protein QNJ16_05515 [Rhodobacter sp.]|nr:hypothetical protein [Rhodobacter sp.]